MGKGYLIDTNIIVHFLAGAYDEPVLNKLEELFFEGFYISFITRIELLSFRRGTSEEMLNRREMVNLASVIYINDEIIGKTIDIRLQMACKTPDAIIAATSITHDLTLLSENDKDFINIQGIQYINPNQSL